MIRSPHPSKIDWLFPPPRAGFFNFFPHRDMAPSLRREGSHLHLKIKDVSSPGKQRHQSFFFFSPNCMRRGPLAFVPKLNTFFTTKLNRFPFPSRRLSAIPFFSPGGNGRLAADTNLLTGLVSNSRHVQHGDALALSQFSPRLPSFLFHARSTPPWSSQRQNRTRPSWSLTFLFLPGFEENPSFPPLPAFAEPFFFSHVSPRLVMALIVLRSHDGETVLSIPFSIPDTRRSLTGTFFLP